MPRQPPHQPAALATDVDMDLHINMNMKSVSLTIYFSSSPLFLRTPTSAHPRDWVGRGHGDALHVQGLRESLEPVFVPQEQHSLGGNERGG